MVIKQLQCHKMENLNRKNFWMYFSQLHFTIYNLKHSAYNRIFGFFPVLNHGCLQTDLFNV